MSLSTGYNPTGVKFNLLTARREATEEEATGNKDLVASEKRWVFDCECGGTKVAQLSNVRSGNTKSCGCLRRRKADKARQSAGLAFWDRLSWDGRTIRMWAEHYSTTPKEIMKRLTRDRYL